jgi:hypothetical protein
MERVKVGDKFTKWEVIGGPLVKGTSAGKYWSCRCQCGSEKDVQQYHLLHGLSKGCQHCRKPASGRVVTEATKKLLSDLAHQRPAPRPKGSFTQSQETRDKISATKRLRKESK